MIKAPDSYFRYATVNLSPYSHIRQLFWSDLLEVKGHGGLSAALIRFGFNTSTQEIIGKLTLTNMFLFCFLLFSGSAEKSSEWMDRYRLKFLGSVQVPFHKGNDVLCAAMQKVQQPLLRENE